MGIFKSQFSRALTVIKSDNAGIPYPAVVKSGTNTTATASKLVCATGLFITNNVAVGDIVYNTTDSTAATVTNVDSETTLSLNANIFAATAKAFTIYQDSQQTGLGNTGCMLYIGGAGNVSITTIGGDTILFSGVPAGTILPVQVHNLNATTGGTTTATLINALW
jgi:hypothetical protein